MLFDNSSNSYESEALNQFYEKLLKEIPDLIFQFKIEKDNSYTMPFVSHSAMEIYGFSREQLEKNIGVVITDRILKEDVPGFLKSVLKSKENLERWNHEYRVHLPNKGIRWLRGSAKPEAHEDGSVVFYGRIADVTANKEQELKLILSERRFESALEASLGGVWEWNLNDNSVFYSPQSLKILDLDFDDSVDSFEKCISKVHPEDVEKYLNDIELHLKGETSFYENSHRVQGKNGIYKWILDRGKVIETDKKGNPIKLIGTHTDISSQKEKEVELQRTLDIVGEQNSRLLNFAHIVSHNLRSHAGNLSMLLDLVDDIDDTEEREEALVHLRTISNDLTQTINHLNDLVSIHTEIKITRESLNLDEFFQRTLNVLSEKINSNGVKIINEIPKDVFIDYNPAYLESILLNLTTNAIKYSDPNRKLEVKFSLESIERRKILTISDNGVGIDLNKNKESLFGMYQTFHHHPDARGIGLFITKNQIEAMGGKIEVESEVGVGTAFKIYFNEKV
ncbi:PAS domain-containing protein [Flavobacterium qiangtangense]|uniref:histidine kinase n=1 Tax=Flavobacterium qiangtangense TaxID=1442595 RepID=A0ABW1PMB3_9FLAO